MVTNIINTKCKKQVQCAKNKEAIISSVKNTNFNCTSYQSINQSISIFIVASVVKTTGED